MLKAFASGLCLALIVLLLGTASTQAGDRSAISQPDAAVAKAILAELLAIDTTHDKGTQGAVDALRARFLAAGFDAADLIVLANPDKPLQVNLLVKLKGQGRLKPLVYLCHLDVVEARPEDWSVPPFAFTEQDGWIYGRGSQDMKGEDANVAAALLRMKREGIKPARDIIVAFTPDEETGGLEGAGWLLHTHRDLIDAGLVLNPDAGTGAFRRERRAFYGVQTSEKTYVTFRAEAINKGGHSSEPRVDNAIYALTAGLDRLAAFKFPIRITDTVRAFYAAQANFEEGERQADMRQVAHGDTTAAQRLATDPSDNAQLRTTCVTTMLDAGHAENALPQRARATIQCRMLPGDSAQQTQTAIETALADATLKVTVTRAAIASPESPPTAAVMALYNRVVSSMWPHLTVMPSMDAGASDSKFTRSAGIATYGATSIFIDLEDMRAHGRDERVKADRFAEGSEFAFRLMKAFSAPGAP